MALTRHRGVGHGHTASGRTRHAAWTLAVALAGWVAADAKVVIGANLDVNSFQSLSNDEPATYDSMRIFASGTYSANAPLTANELWATYPNGTLNVNANVTIDQPVFRNGARLHLNSGTFTTNNYLDLSGSSVVMQRGGGTYDARVLYLAGGVSASFAPGDVVRQHVYVQDGSALTMDADLQTNLLLISGSTSTVVKNGHSFAVQELHVNDGVRSRRPAPTSSQTSSVPRVVRWIWPEDSRSTTACSRGTAARSRDPERVRSWPSGSA